MAVKDVAGTQGTFVERTKVQEEINTNVGRRNLPQPVITSLLKHVGGTANALFEPTSSDGLTLSTHFMVTSQSNVESLNSFSGSLADGTAYNAKGLVIGTMYPIALSYVSASTHVQLDLFR